MNRFSFRRHRPLVAWLLVIACASILAGCAVLLLRSAAHGSAPADSSPPPSACTDQCALIIEPDGGVAPVLGFIGNAMRSLDVVMYELEDPAIVAALEKARDRGVAVRVLLNGTVLNDAAYYALRVAGIPVRYAPAYFTFTHEKSMVADGAKGLIMTFNLVPKYYATGRDFGVFDTNARDARAMEAAFAADWDGDPAQPAPAGDDLVWSPGSRHAILGLIASAHASLEIYNEEMADEDVAAALVAAAGRGVTVRVVMTYSQDWHAAFATLAAAGVHVRTFPATASGLYIHAKVIVADGSRAFVGSENFSATSFDENRELGVLLASAPVIAGLRHVFEADWAAAQPFRSG